MVEPTRCSEMYTNYLSIIYMYTQRKEQVVTDNLGLTEKIQTYSFPINSLINEQKTAPSGLVCGPNSATWCFGTP